MTPERAAPTAEAAIYFTIAGTDEYRRARARTVDAADDALVAEVIYDGVGGARATAESGLRGLADRLEAVGGTLSIESPPGGGTRVCARDPHTTAAAREAA